MAKITLDQIKEEISVDGWKLLSTEYKNLTTQMTFECPHGHQVFAPWQKLRTRRDCPVCKQNSFTQNAEEILPKPKGATRILALDQATKVTGYSIFDDGKLVKVGTFTTTSDDEVARCVSIKNWFLSMLQSWKPDYVGIEGIQYQPKVFDGDTVGSVTLFQTLAHLQGVLLITCHEQGIHYRVCPTNTWRNVCGVKGRARADKKRSMQIIAKQWYNINATDDEADAIGIGHYMTTIVNKNTTISNWEI